MREYEAQLNECSSDRFLCENGVQSEERGSAVAEFVLLALPLLLPATLFFVAMSQSANHGMSGSLMARHAVSAFVSGADDRHGHARVEALLREYKSEDARILEIGYQVSCQYDPCITPSAAVALSLRVVFKVAGMDALQVSRNTYRAVGFVDKWGATS